MSIEQRRTAGPPLIAGRSGQYVSRALLRADPSWAPLRGHPGFERLITGR